MLGLACSKVGSPVEHRLQEQVGFDPLIRAKSHSQLESPPDKLCELLPPLSQPLTSDTQLEGARPEHLFRESTASAQYLKRSPVSN